MSVQVITFPHDAYEAQLRGANWIQRYIFPGGVLPSLAAIEASLDDTQLLVTGVHDIRDSYARTLQTWRTSFFGTSTRFAPWASTSASSACGTTTSPSARQASARA